MQRFLIEFSYDGSSYCGYQKQENKKTIQEEIETALTKINNNKEVKIHSSGRTDKKVHANSQYAHLDMNIEIDCYHLKSALNSKLPEDIYIKKAIKVSNDFHARYMVKSKTYLYKINTGIYNPIERNYIYQYSKDLNITLIKRILKLYKGTHNFICFTSNDIKKDFIRTIYNTKIKVNNNYINIYITGNGFLKYQVRYMIGLIISICENKSDINKLKTVLEGKGEKLNKIAPPQGLYLDNIKY